MPTVEEQWIYACFVNTADAWQAVIDYFPDDAYYWGSKAKRQLLRYYYFTNNKHDSLPLFQEFAELSPLDQDNRMLGFAGVAWCLLTDSASASDIQMAQFYLSEIPLYHVLNSDELFRQIFDAATETLRRKRREMDTN
jgi:hypothetical protein